MEWSFSSTNFKFSKDVYFTSRADVSCCGRCGLVKGWKMVAIGTRKRTVHVFPVNPYGGKADIAGLWREG
jgi:hypothetical protein